MKITIKAIALMIAMITILAMLPVSASAAKVESDAEPMWENTGTTTTHVGFVNGKGYAEATVVGHQGTTRVQIDVYVYKMFGFNWIYVAEKHEDAYRHSWGISCEFDPVLNATYRTEYTFTVTKNNVDEVIHDSRYDAYIPE